MYQLKEIQIDYSSMYNGEKCIHMYQKFAHLYV
jgi:hypothetical protein